MDFIKLNRETYNKIAKAFYNTRKFVWPEIKPLVKYVKEGSSVLDLGCGTGRLYQFFKEIQGVSYTGLDFSIGQIGEAQENFPEGNFVVGEMTSLPFADKEFDLIFCIATFHHLPDEETRLKALLEMKRVLKDEGVLVMTNWHMWSDWWQEKVAQGKYRQIGEQDFIVPWKNSNGEVVAERYYYGFKETELVDLLEKSGFTLVEQYTSSEVKWLDEKGGKNLITVAKI